MSQWSRKASEGPFDYHDWAAQSSSTGPMWYDEATDPDRELRQSRPIDIRRVRQLALKHVESAEEAGDGVIGQESVVEWNDDDDFDFNEEHGDDAAVTAYGSISEEYNPNIYSKFSRDILTRMGYNVYDPELFLSGKGLGKDNSGIAAPVQGDLSRWGTTAGLGSISAVQHLKHTYKKPEIELKIPVEWIPRLDEDAIVMPPGADQEDFTLDEDSMFNSPSTWCGLRVKTISYTDSTYCPLDIQLELFSTKSKFDDVGNDVFLDARNRSNPYELLKKEYFQNRAALKMAELDAECGHIFTNPPCYQIENDKYPCPYYWGDVCAGPGGFSEFISTVVKWKGKGFGFTLKADNDFQLEKFNQCATPQTFQAFYGDGTGDVTRTANLISYSNEVYQGTGGRMLHVMMADGGFSVAGKENYQELLSRQLLLCQCAAALLSLRKGGVCVIKMFDNFLRFTIDCIYLMRLAFEDVAIVKPHQSRPANSERYLVCKGLRQQGGVNHPIAAYMLRVNDMMNQVDPLHHQSGLVQNAESKPLLFLSAGILAGAQFDGNRDVDAEGNIIDVSEQQAKLAAEAREQQELDSKSKKRSRSQFEDEDDLPGAPGAGNGTAIATATAGAGAGPGTGKYGADSGDEDAKNGFSGLDNVFEDPDGDVYLEAYDDYFAIEYDFLPSIQHVLIQERCYYGDEAVRSGQVEPGFNKYGDPIPPEPRPDRDLMRQQQKYVSSDIYTDKFKAEEKHKKKLRQQGKLPEQDEDQYTFSMKDIIVKGQTIHSLVPLKYHDKAFAAYILEWNQSYAVQQVQWLRRILEYIQDPNLPTDDQERIRMQCLQRWKIVMDQKNESGDGMVHWSPIWGRLWTDPAVMSKSNLRSDRLLKDLSTFIQRLADVLNKLSAASGGAGHTVATDQIVTSSIRNQEQIQAIIAGGQSMASFTNINNRSALQQNLNRVGGLNAAHAGILMGRSSGDLFGSTSRFISQFALYYNLCRFVYYNTHCIDMAYVLQLVGLDVQYLRSAVRLAEIKKPENFKALQAQIAAILTHWFRFINKQRPILSPPEQPPIVDGNVVLEARDQWGTASTSWAFLPVPANAKRCIALTLNPGKHHVAFNRTFLSAIFPHHHLLLTSPQHLQSKLAGLHFSGDGANFRNAINPLLAQIVAANKQDVVGHQDQMGDAPSKRGPIAKNEEPASGTAGASGASGTTPNSASSKIPVGSSFYKPAAVPTTSVLQTIDGVFRHELNGGREGQFLQQNIQHDVSTGLFKSFPADMLLDCFVNLDVPPAISAQRLTKMAAATLGPQQQAIGQLPVPTPRFRATIYDAWSMPHQTNAKNAERYMYERLAYNDRFQNLKVFADTMRIREPSLPQRPGAPPLAPNASFAGQDIKTQKLLHHSRHPLSQRNRNAVVDMSAGTGRPATLSINQLTSGPMPDPHKFPSAVEFARGWDLGDWMRKPVDLWNFKASAKEPSKDNLFIFQKGHKLYSLSIWVALFSVRSHPPDQLLVGVNQQVAQQRIGQLRAEGKAEQTDAELDELYAVLKRLQQFAICDAITATWGQPQRR